MLGRSRRERNSPANSHHPWFAASLPAPFRARKNPGPALPPPISGVADAWVRSNTFYNTLLLLSRIGHSATRLSPHAAGVVDDLAGELGLLDGAEAAVVDQQRDHVGLGDGVLGVGHGHVAELVEPAGQRRCVRLGHQGPVAGPRGP